MSGWQGKEVVVTGGAGFIGSHLSRELIDVGALVTIIDDLSGGYESNVPEGANFIKGCISDRELMASTLCHAQMVFHLAAIASVPKCEEDPEFSHQINEISSKSIIQNANSPVVFASSAAIYGDPEYLPIDENHPITPLGHYGNQKANVDASIRDASIHSNPVTALRFFNVYGPGQDPSSQYSGVLSIFLDRTAKGEGLTIFGNGEQTRDFIHVSDVVAALMGIAKSLMENGVGSPCHSQAYNICTGNAVTLNQVVSVLEKLNGEEINVTYEAIRRGDIKESSGTSKKLQQTLEWAPKVSLDFGLKELLI